MRSLQPRPMLQNIRFIAKGASSAEQWRDDLVVTRLKTVWQANLYVASTFGFGATNYTLERLRLNVSVT